MTGIERGSLSILVEQGLKSSMVPSHATSVGILADILAAQRCEHKLTCFGIQPGRCIDT